MKNSIEFVSEEVKNNFRVIMAGHPAIIGVMDTLSQKILVGDEKVKGTYQIVGATTHEPSTIQVYINNSTLVNIDIYEDQKVIKASCDKLPYKVLFGDYAKKHLIIKGYEYENEKRSILLRHIETFVPTENISYSFVITENGKNYQLFASTKLKIFNTENFIEQMMKYEKSINNIQELLFVISKIIDLKCTTVIIHNDRGDYVKFEEGRLVTYVESREEEGEKQRIYFKDGNFYIERVRNEEYMDDGIEFVKKIGVFDGKKAK